METEKIKLLSKDIFRQRGELVDFTNDDREWLKVFAWKTNQKNRLDDVITYEVRSVKGKKGATEEVPVLERSDRTTTALAALAVHTLYEKEGKKLILDEQGIFRVIPTKDYETNEQIFLSEAFNIYKVPTALGTLYNYIVGRWECYWLKKVDLMKELEDFVSVKNPLLYCDRTWHGLQIVAKKIQKGELERVQSDEIYRALSQGIEAPEPYRHKIIDYIFQAPIKYRLWLYDNVELMGAEPAFQAVPIFKGLGGLGKSRLVETLGLGAGAKISGIQETTQKNIFLRASYFVLENAELSGTAKADLNALKEAITTPTMTYNPKYANGIKELPTKAFIIATTNSPEILKDMTGSERRFWPIELINYDHDKVTQEWVARAYATNLIYYQDLLNQYRKIYSTNPVKLHKAVQQVLSLNLPETQEDLAYKHENYSQPDPALHIVKSYFRELVEAGLHTTAKQGDAYLGVVDRRKEKKAVFAFGLKATIDINFQQWLSEKRKAGEVMPKTVYTGKAFQYLDGVGIQKTVVKLNGKSVKASLVDGEKLALELDIQAPIYGEEWPLPMTNPDEINEVTGPLFSN